MIKRTIIESGFGRKYAVTEVQLEDFVNMLDLLRDDKDRTIPMPKAPESTALTQE